MRPESANNPSAETLLESLFDGVYYVDLKRRITFWNRAAERITGYARDTVIGSRCSDNILRHTDASGTVLCTHSCPLAATMADGELRETEAYLHHRDGHRVPVIIRAAPVHDEQGNVTGAVEVFTDDRRRTQLMSQLRELQHQAMIDQLTSMPNRRFGDMRLENLLDNARREDIPFGVLMLDVDWFKHVNDTFGHLIGDRVLRMVAKTIESSIRPLDDAIRWGGEEFLVLLHNCSVEGLGLIAEQIRVLVEQSWLSTDSGDVRVTISIGGTRGTAADTAETAVNRADGLLMRSKREGRNRVILSE